MPTHDELIQLLADARVYVSRHASIGAQQVSERITQVLAAAELERALQSTEAPQGAEAERA